MFFIGLVLSLAIGLSLGLLGGGGSILTVPVLHYVFGIDMHDTVAMSLVVVALTSAFALLPHARAGNVRWKSGLSFGMTSVISAFGSARLGAYLPGELLIVAFAGLMIAVGATMITRAGRVTPRPRNAPSTGRMLLVGIGVGALTGLLGAGGGFLVVPALTLVGRLALREAIATSLLVIVLNSFSALAGAAGHAAIDAGVLVPVVATAMAGSMLGMRLGRRLSVLQLQRGFGGFIILIGALILTGELV
ncbi:MAG: sulfite exporter TauE/SafE family protein [Kofleriaceae bacterium]|nr:sulfite exporter TauE/SafE family protein [Kofleriaceae bacterium]